MELTTANRDLAVAIDRGRSSSVERCRACAVKPGWLSTRLRPVKSMPVSASLPRRDRRGREAAALHSIQLVSRTFNFSSSAPAPRQAGQCPVSLGARNVFAHLPAEARNFLRQPQYAGKFLQMARNYICSFALLFGLAFGCCSHDEPRLNPTTELDGPSIDTLDDADSTGTSETDEEVASLPDTAQSTGWVGTPTFISGAFSPQTEEAIAKTKAGWAILMILGAEALTSSRDGHLTTLDPGMADNNRLALLPVGLDGAPASPIEIARTSGFLVSGGMSRCGDNLWGAATTSDALESWVFRARTDLSELTVARFVATGNDAIGGRGVAQIYSVQCSGTEATFVVRLTAGMQVIPPIASAIDFPRVQGETWLLVDGESLFDSGKLEHIGEANVAIGTVRQGRQQTAIFAASDVNGGVQVARTRILRHDFATSLTSRLIDVDLPSNVFNPIYAEDLSPDGTGDLAVLCARYQGAFELGDFTIADPLSSDFCAVVRGGRVTAVRAFQNIVPTDVAISGGAVWFSGSLAGADPTLGGAANGDFVAFLAGLDASNLELHSSAYWFADGRDTFVRSMIEGASSGPCADQSNVAMEVASYDRTLGYGAPKLELAMAGRSGTACTNTIASVDGYDSIERTALFSALNQTSCATAQRLAVLPHGLKLSVGSQTTSAASGQERFSIVVFAPEECSITSP